MESTPRLATRTTVLTLLGLLLLGTWVARTTRGRVMWEVAWPDECIYLVGARNLTERQTLNTNFYLSHSLLARGYPHRDVHMPGYVLALAPFVWRWGATLSAAAGLNVTLFLASIALVYAIGRGLLEDQVQAATAAGLFAILPPFPGYLFVAYPEILVTFVLLLGLAWLVHGGGVRHAAVAGVLFGLGPLFRETLLFALPFYVVRIPRRELWRAFLPAAVATLLLVVAPLSRDRALHPNAIYPGVLEEARRSSSPTVYLATALGKNVTQNLALAAQADPRRSTEDAVLLSLALLVAAAAIAPLWLPPASRKMALANLASLGVLTAAVLLLYVVRERGGVWGGVRAYMTWAPVSLVLAMPILFRPPQAWIRVLLVAALAFALVDLDQWQIYFFNRYKGSSHEDQDRNARYLDRYLIPYRPKRIVSRSFLYGFRQYPVEVVWSLPKDEGELRALEETIAFDFLVLHEKSPLRFGLADNPRYVQVNREDRGPEFLIYRRLE